MVVTHKARRGRKLTGGRYGSLKLKRKAQRGNRPINTTIAVNKTKIFRAKGGNRKVKLVAATDISVLDQKTKKHFKTTIKAVLENPASRHFVRQNVITKGAIVDTEKGKAKVTSRPGQDGTINAVLI